VLAIFFFTTMLLHTEIECGLLKVGDWWWWWWWWWSYEDVSPELDVLVWLEVREKANQEGGPPLEQGVRRGCITNDDANAVNQRLRFKSAQPL
jgi:hypothetical protein